MNPIESLPKIFGFVPRIDGLPGKWWIETTMGNNDTAWLGRDGLWTHPALAQEFFGSMEEAVAFCFANASGPLPPRVLAMCKARNWSLHWTARGAYLHLEASELIEAIRGKHGDPKKEAADVLLVLMSITEANGINWSDVEAQANLRTAELMATASQPYKEERSSSAPTSNALTNKPGEQTK